jgi:hypothetical protein
MQPTTEQLLATIEVLSNPSCVFFWETTTQGQFNIWNLMISQGLTQLTDLELAFEHWQNIEKWGTPTNQQKFGEYAPPRDERKNDIWNENIAKERRQYYQQIQEFMTNNLHNLQSYNLSVAQKNNFEWEHPNFSVSIVLGETGNNNWFCLLPTIPDQVSYYHKSNQYSAQIISEETCNLINPIPNILEKLTPLKIYGYYYGGYNYTYQHYLVCAYAKNKITAIELALQAAGMVFVEKLTGDYISHIHNRHKLSQFMNKCLQYHTRYSINFWDVGYSYEIGQTPTGDWIGVSCQSEFEYNP